MTTKSGFSTAVHALSEEYHRVGCPAHTLHKRVGMGNFARRARCRMWWMTLAMTTSCVVPIPATPEESDAGPRKDTPTIVKAGPTDFPGPLQLPGTQMITVTLRDADLLDTLHVRVFKNYGPGNESRGIDERTVPNAVINPTPDRSWSFSTEVWCTGSVGQNVKIDFVVADEPFKEDGFLDGDVKFKTPINNGRWSERNFIVACNQ